MIYTIGYQGLSMTAFLAVLEEKKINILVDVRSRPYGRAYQYNRKALEALAAKISKLYWHKGDVLGGFSVIDESAIDWLAGCVASNGCEFGANFKVPDVEFNYLLICFEADPYKCHRYYDIGRRLAEKGIQAVHLYKGAEFTTSDLENAVPECLF